MKNNRTEVKGEHVYAVFCKYVSFNILSMLGLSLYILADTFFIANGVGNKGLVALNLVLPIYSLMNGIGLLLGIGGATRFAMARGQGEKERYSVIFMQSFQIAVVLGAVYTLIGVVFSEQLVRLLGATEEVVPYAVNYLKTITAFSIAFMVNNVLVCFVRNDNEPNLAMVAMLTGSISNIILDYVFVFPLGMGMFGAAFATGLSPVFSMCILSKHFLKKKNTFHFVKCRFYAAEIKNIVLVGIPSFITEFSSGIIILLFNFVILNIEGNSGVGAYGIISNIALVCIAIFTGIAQGIQPILSEDYGAGKKDNLKKIFMLACITATGFGVLCYGAGVLFSKEIIDIFNKDKSAALEEIAQNGIQLYFITFLFAGINIVTSAYFACIAKAKEAFFISALRGFIAVIPLILILPGWLGINGVWLTVPITEILTIIAGIFLIWRMNVKNHKKIC